MESRLGEGTTFTLWLPRAPATARLSVHAVKPDPSWSAFENRLQVALTGDLESKSHKAEP